MKKSVIITGGSGTLGKELRRIIPDSYTVFAPSHKNADIVDFDRWIDLLRDREFDLMIHCAAYTDVAGAEKNDAEAIRANVHGPATLAELAFMTGNPKRFVHISTDYVFDGKKGSYKEDDECSPVNRYGITKYLGEVEVNKRLQNGLHGLIIRTSFKPNKPWPYPKAFNDIYTSADYVDVIAPLILEVSLGDLEGIVHIGTERKTVYELASRRSPEVGQMSRLEVPNLVLPHDVSLNLDRLTQWRQARVAA